MIFLQHNTITKIGGQVILSAAAHFSQTEWLETVILYEVPHPHMHMQLSIYSSGLTHTLPLHAPYLECLAHDNHHGQNEVVQQYSSRSFTINTFRWVKSCPT